MSDLALIQKRLRDFPAEVKVPGNPSAPCTNADLNRLADKTCEMLKLILKEMQK